MGMLCTLLQCVGALYAALCLLLPSWGQVLFVDLFLCVGHPKAAYLWRDSESTSRTMPAGIDPDNTEHQQVGGCVIMTPDDGPVEPPPLHDYNSPTFVLYTLVLRPGDLEELLGSTRDRHLLPFCVELSCSRCAQEGSCYQPQERHHLPCRGTYRTATIGPTSERTLVILKHFIVLLVQCARLGPCLVLCYRGHVFVSWC